MLGVVDKCRRFGLEAGLQLSVGCGRVVVEKGGRLMAHWTHIGPLHWFTGCWHFIHWEYVRFIPYGVPAGAQCIDRCCLCGRTRPGRSVTP